MLNNIKKNKSGFTIIEVLIVLAIAGLILLVVFLAVPALQRNQRNQGYRSEANRILASAQEISANNGGSILTVSSCAGAPAAPAAGNCNLTTGTVTNAQKIYQASNAKNVVNVKIVDGSAVTAATAPSSTPVGASALPAEQVSLVGVTIFTGSKCVGQDKYVKGTTRQTVLMYAVEDNAGNVVVQCQES